MSQYIPAAEIYYAHRVLPREDRDPVAEEVYLKERGVSKAIYRRVLASETAGQLYPFRDHFFAMSRYSSFGLGIGVYFFQLLAFAAVTLIAGLILIPVIQSYDTSDYGINSSTDIRLSGTAACYEAINVTATCIDSTNGANSTCYAMYRDSCEYPGSAVYAADLGMVVAVAALLIASRFVQNSVQERLDDKLQSTQDYSLMVTNPPPDATDAEEWRAFFSRFGTVRYVTVVKMNSNLLDLLLRKKLLLREFERIGVPVDAIPLGVPAKTGFFMRFLWSLGCDARSKERLLHRLYELNMTIERETQSDFPVGCVYVTFELEDAKQFCMHSLRNEKAFCASINNVYQEKLRFRGRKSLTVLESSEPDNVVWENSGMRRLNRFRRTMLSYCLCGGTMYMSYLAVNSARNDPLLMLVYITLIDNFLPIIFTYITDIEGFVDEDDRQNSLMVKLFAARLLSSTVFPFITTEWYSFLSSETVVRIKNVVLSCCFVSPTVALLDLDGFVKRQILTRLFAHSQEDANRYWSGYPFTIANRYTEVSKIVFIVLFNSLVDPGSLFIAAIAFVYIYAVDRYMLLRRSGRAPLLDNSMGPMVLKQVALALVAKLVVSLYYTYSWPMDSVYKNDQGDLIEVDKIAHLGFWRLEREPWHSDSQWAAVVYYRRFLYAIGAIVVVSWAYDVVVAIIETIFTKTSYDFAPTQAAKFTPFSALKTVTAYVPTVRFGPESFVAADTRFMQSRHRPDTLDLHNQGDTDVNLASLLPHYALEKCMSSVTWFEDETEPRHNQLRRKTLVMASSDVELGSIMDAPKLKSAERLNTPDSRAPPVDSLTASSRGGAALAKRRFQTGSARMLILSRGNYSVGTVLPVQSTPQQTPDKNAHPDMSAPSPSDQTANLSPSSRATAFYATPTSNDSNSARIYRSSSKTIPVSPTAESNGTSSAVRELIQSAQRRNVEKVPFSNDEKELLKKMKKAIFSDSIKGKRNVKILLGRGKSVDFDEFYTIIKERCPNIFAAPTTIDVDEAGDEYASRGPSRIRGRSSGEVVTESTVRMQLRIIFVKFLSRQREQQVIDTSASTAALSPSTASGGAPTTSAALPMSPTPNSTTASDQVDVDAFFKFVGSFTASS